MGDDILDRLKRFRYQYFPRFRDRYRALVEGGQRPRALFIGCSDSRVVPDLLTGASPGELFVARNVGNFVPPYDGAHGHHGTAAAVEYAVLVLGVRDIIVCGHSHCGAVRALYEDPDPRAPHLAQWLELGRAAVLPVTASAEALRRTEQRSVALQLERLMGYPMVRERVEGGNLSLHGWHYRIEDGAVDLFDIEGGAFVPLEAAAAQADAEHMRGINLLP